MMPRVNHQAIKNLDYEQYKMVREALHERATVLKVAPHLSYQMPIMLPIYKWWQVLPVALLLPVLCSTQCVCPILK